MAALISATLVVGAGWPASAAYEAAQPDPLRRDERLVVQDIAASDRVVAIGWRQARRPGRLMVAFSKDGGQSYLKNNGKLRKFRTLGLPARGISLDVCGRKGDRDLWIATAVRQGGDDSGDADVLLTRRSVRSPIKDAYQAFLTSPSAKRSVRSVDVACVGNRYLAVAWLEKTPRKTRARVMIRDQASFGRPRAAESRVFNLGIARYKGGISVAATSRAIHVAWTRGDGRDLRYRRFLVGGDAKPPVEPQPAVRMASADVLHPELAAQWKKVAIGYSDAGRVKARLSRDLGASFERASVLIDSGSVKQPSRVHSISVSGRTIVVEATRREPDTDVATPQRWRSDDRGETWGSQSFGHDGARVGVLLRSGSGEARLAEAWHDDGGPSDTLRAQIER